MITTTWSTQSPVDGEVRRCVRATENPNQFKWVESRISNGRTVAEGFCERSDLPPDVAMSADILAGKAFSFVDWPKTESRPQTENQPEQKPEPCEIG